ncbi:shufflon system plasmid conjugative transfer pilus tip adhesin PilV [Tistlia consotensis]|nr:shufflon system plasmid conjugative transfer pilus tip adhesin PilV [Tistlia consotensis]
MLLGALAALALAALTLPRGVAMLQEQTDRQLRIVSGSQASAVLVAADAYAKAHFPTLAVGSEVAIPLADLVDEGLLRAGLSGQTALGQSIAVTAGADASGPAGGAVTIVVALTGGPPLGLTDRVKLAAAIGEAGGYLRQTDAASGGGGSEVYGAFHGWCSDGCDPADLPGDLSTTQVLAVERLPRQSVLEPYLYRVAVPGFPEANRMSTDLDLDGFDLTGAGRLDAGDVAVSGSLSVAGDASIGGALSVTGTLSAGELQASGPVTVDDLAVEGTATLAGPVAVSGLISADSLSTSGDLQAAGLTVEGSASAAALSVAGPVAASSLSASSAEVTDLVAGSATASSLEVSGTATAVQLDSGDASIAGNASLGGNLAVGGGAAVTGTLQAGAVGADSLVVGSCTGC